MEVSTVEINVETGVEIDIEIGIWWVWQWWHGVQFLGLVLAVGFLVVLVVGVHLDMGWWVLIWV